MPKKYSNKELQQLINWEVIYPKKSTYYRKRLKESIEAKGGDFSKYEDPEGESDLCHDELWYDVCDMVVELAQLLLDEREKRVEIINDLKETMRDSIRQLGAKQFTD